MRRLLFATLCLLTAIGGLATLRAQTTPVATLPWNNYTPQRIPDNFQTIIGQPGTVLIPNTSQDDDGSFFFPLDMSFYFIDRTYNPTGVANGYQLYVTTNG